jgi:signal transduction histidine kinase
MDSVTKPAAGALPVLPDPEALDRQLLEQQILLVRSCAIPLAVIGAVWACVMLYTMLTRDDGGVFVPHMVVPALVGLIGFASYRFCVQEYLRASSFALVTALVAIASISLAFLSNSEHTALVTFCVAASVAALTLDIREVLAVGGIIVVCAMTAMLCHELALVPQVALPFPQAVIAGAIGIGIGLPYPLIMLWHFRRYLFASRSEAWTLARSATEARGALVERTRELETSHTKVRAKNEELSDFLYIVSHDLRSPLINLEGFSRELQDSLQQLTAHIEMANPGAEPVAGWNETKAELDESLGFILRSVSKMDLLVNALLELSRIETRSGKIETVDLSSTVEEILASLHFQIEQRGVEVTTRDLPIVYGDPVRISQVFGNLIDNAVKYMKPDGEARISISAKLRDNEWVISVRDTGVGIRLQDQSKVFKLFTRVGNNDKAGDGVGLTAVKKIIEKRGGRIWLESKPGLGCAFSFTWPCEINDEDGMEVCEDEAA